MTSKNNKNEGKKHTSVCKVNKESGRCVFLKKKKKKSEFALK